MRMKKRKKYLQGFWSSILCMTLIVAIALFTTGCNGSTKDSPDTAAVTAEEKEDPIVVYGEENDENTQFSLTVVDMEGTETQFVIHTDKETVGEALLELDLIAGDESEYGLYVKTVNGITADYDKDGVYWAFYVNGEYAQSGVDSTTIEDGAGYAFKIEK